MTPVPYKSKWCEKIHYLIMGFVRGKIVTAVVPNGVQAVDGHLFDSIREAKWWLKRNGFEKM